MTRKSRKSSFCLIAFQKVMLLFQSPSRLLFYNLIFKTHKSKIFFENSITIFVSLQSDLIYKQTLYSYFKYSYKKCYKNMRNQAHILCYQRNKTLKKDENWCVTKTKINVFSNHKRILYEDREKKNEKKFFHALRCVGDAAGALLLLDHTNTSKVPVRNEMNEKDGCNE